MDAESEKTMSNEHEQKFLEWFEANWSPLTMIGQQKAMDHGFLAMQNAAWEAFKLGLELGQEEKEKKP
jgi:hypothetical protein